MRTTKPQKRKLIKSVDAFRNKGENVMQACRSAKVSNVTYYKYRKDLNMRPYKAPDADKKAAQLLQKNKKKDEQRALARLAKKYVTAHPDYSWQDISVMCGASFYEIKKALAAEYPKTKFTWKGGEKKSQSEFLARVVDTDVGVKLAGRQVSFDHLMENSLALMEEAIAFETDRVLKWMDAKILAAKKASEARLRERFLELAVEMEDKHEK